MAFRFPLKALWRVRAIYERRERPASRGPDPPPDSHAKATRTLRQGRLEQAGSLAKSLQKGMTGAELQFQVVCSIVRAEAYQRGGPGCRKT